MTDPAIGRMVSVFRCPSRKSIESIITKNVQTMERDNRRERRALVTNQIILMQLLGMRVSNAANQGIGAVVGQSLLGLHSRIHHERTIQLVPIPVEPHSLVHRRQTREVLNEAGVVPVPEEGEVASGDEVVVRQRIVLSVLRTTFDILLRFEFSGSLHCTLSTLFYIFPFRTRCTMIQPRSA